MGFYSRVIFPRGCDYVMSREDVSELRRELLSGVRGEVLEIGFGTGLNLAHYPDHVRELTTVEPNPGMLKRAARRIREAPLRVRNLQLKGESLPLPDQSFDTVVSSWTLCSIRGIERALAEVYRVLRPGGRFHFVEHGRARESGVRRWQDWLNPVQRIVGDGCNLNRDIPSLVQGAGFRLIEHREFYMEGAPRILGYTYLGVAARAAGC